MKRYAITIMGNDKPGLFEKTKKGLEQRKFNILHCESRLSQSNRICFFVVKGMESDSSKNVEERLKALESELQVKIIVQNTRLFEFIFH